MKKLSINISLFFVLLTLSSTGKILPVGDNVTVPVWHRTG